MSGIQNPTGFVIEPNFIYKITVVSKKKSAVTVVGLTGAAKKNLKKAVIPKSIRIKSKSGKNKGTYSYAVKAVAANAFKGNKKITEVSIGDNVTVIGKKAFANCTKLKKVTLGRSVKTIQESAFAGNKKLTQVVIPKNAKLETIGKYAFKGCTSLKNINLENAAHIKKIDATAFDNTSVDRERLEDIEEKIEEKEVAEKYSYEVIPLLAPFNSYFYIKTDNPDPDTFRFVDETTQYADKTGSIAPTDTLFADVRYENTKTKRVKGGYIAVGSATDGGVVRLRIAKCTGSYPLYNLTTGEVTMEKEYEYTDTDVTVTLPELKDEVDYLISTYGDSSKSYFDNLSAIQNGFSSICLYSGAYVLGDLKKSASSPYYGLSTSPHVDQTFYIQDPYYRTDSKAMLISSLHPMRYDSIGFPSVMMAVAKKLDRTAVCKWSSSAHYLIEVTYNGETRTYGGAGSGGGQGIYASQIKYWYSFDQSAEDAASGITLDQLAKRLMEYGALEVPEETTDLPKLTWSSVRSTVGKDGSYVRLCLLTSIFGGNSVGYTYLYDDGSTGEGSQGWGAVGYFSNAWYDGRYFNKWEYIYPGAKFEETVKTEDPSIVLKDVQIKLPNDGKTYLYHYRPMEEAANYNPETGVWSGFMTFRYDSSSQTWKADILNSIKYWEGYSYQPVEDPDFIDACTITMEEALAMNLDRNTDKDPENYYIYDLVTEPGTYHGSGN